MKYTTEPDMTKHRCNFNWREVNCDKETSSFLPFSTNDNLEGEAIKRNLNNVKMNWPPIDDEPLRGSNSKKKFLCVLMLCSSSLVRC